MTSEKQERVTDLPAPGVWEREFMLALRLRGFDRIQTNDALALVEARCAAAGLNPFETFGDPVAHAAYVRPPAARRSRRSSVAVVAPALGLATGVNLTVDALLYWSGAVVISVGTVVAMVVLVAILAVLARVFARAVTGTINLVSALVGGVGLMMLMQWALPHVLTTASPPGALMLGLLFVALGVTVRQLQSTGIVAAP